MIKKLKNYAQDNESNSAEYCENPEEAIKSNTTQRIVEIVESKNNSFNGLNEFLEDFNSKKPLEINEIDQLIIYLQEPQTIEVLKELSKKLKFVYSQENKDFLNEYILDENGNTTLSKMREYLIKQLQNYQKTYDGLALESGVEVGERVVEDIYKSKFGDKVLKYNKDKKSLEILMESDNEYNITKYDNGLIKIDDKLYGKCGLFKYENGNLELLENFKFKDVNIYDNGIIEISDISTSEVSFGIIKGGKFEIIGNIDNSKDRIKVYDEEDILIALNGKDYWIISKNGIIEINDLNLIEIISLKKGKIICKKGIIYKYDFESCEIKKSKINNKKTNAFYEINLKYFIPKKGYIENIDLAGDKNFICLKKSGFSLKNKSVKLDKNDITPEQISTYFEEIIF